VKASRRNLLARLENDPLARSIEYTLAAAAVLALLLAALGLWTTLVGDLRDERGDLFDLEAQGVGPDTLRSHLRVRALALLAFGLAGGVLLGWVLSRLVVSLIQVSADTSSPQPPLVTAFGWPTTLAALVALVLAAGIAVEVSVRRAFRETVPLRPSWSAE
jgi:ABC-type antimicrobial peptide transport system permease subunit